MIANFITFLVILATDIVNQVRRYGGGNFCTLPRYDRERKKRRNGVGILPITGPLCYFFLPRKRNGFYTYCNFTKNKWKIYSELGRVYPDNYTHLLIPFFYLYRTTDVKGQCVEYRFKYSFIYSMLSTYVKDLTFSAQIYLINSKFPSQLLRSQQS